MGAFFRRLFTRRRQSLPAPRTNAPAITDLDLLRALGCDE